MKAKTAILIATIYLLFFIVAIHFGFPESLVYLLFALSPVLLIWLAVTILKDTSVEYRELEEDEEWGYFRD